MFLISPNKDSAIAWLQFLKREEKKGYREMAKNL